MPFTDDADLFTRVADLGKDLMWWATFGERFRPLDSGGKPIKMLPPGTAKNTVAVPSVASAYPKEFSYDRAPQTLVVGDGKFAPVTPEVWAFAVSGLYVVQSWLGYRMRRRAGKTSSELDSIRPERWTCSRELLDLLAVVEHFVAVTPEASALLDEVVSGGLIAAERFPTPTDADRRAPVARRVLADTPELF